MSRFRMENRGVQQIQQQAHAWELAPSSISDDSSNFLVTNKKSYLTYMKFASDLTLSCRTGTGQTGAATYGIRPGFFFTGLHTFHLTFDQQERGLKWEWALDRIARLVKDSRDKSFKTVSKAKVKEMQADGTEIEVEKEFVVNRTDSIAHVGSAALDNEECYLLQKLVRSWGLSKGRERHPPKRSKPARSKLRIPAPEKAVCPLHPGKSSQHYRNPD